MKIEQILKSVEHNIGEVSKFLWNSLGDSKVWDIKNIEGEVVGTFIANKEGEVLEVDFDHTYGDKDVFYRWIKPELQFAYLAEYNEKAKSSHKFVELEDELDCLEKVNAVVNIKSFDSRVVTPINLADEDFLLIAKMAHAANITFNDQINVMLQSLVNTYGQPKNALPYFGDVANPQVTHVATFKESVTPTPAPGASSVLEVQEDSNGDLFIEFPQDIIESVGWKEGDTIDWQDQGNRSFILKKV